MKIVSVILARGGSKGILKKNLIPLRGKPLISYTLQTSIKSNVSETWVSTDCEEIKETSKTLGANVINRPSYMSGDKSKSEEALLDFAKKIDFDVVVFIQPTSPLLNISDINSSLSIMKEKELDSIFSVYKEHWIPRWTAKEKPYPNWDIYHRPMRQDIPEMYVENGAFYITTKKALLESKLRYSGNIGVYEMPMSRSFQVDTQDDLNIIEKLL
tara:strand:+ start:545 stop:1186 length:642 start_codon:yes stop_codon:yes gene_type:complete